MRRFSVLAAVAVVCVGCTREPAKPVAAGKADDQESRRQLAKKVGTLTLALGSDDLRRAAARNLPSDWGCRLVAFSWRMWL